MSQSKEQPEDGLPQGERETCSPPGSPREYFVFRLPCLIRVNDQRLYPRNIKHGITVLTASCGLVTPLGSNIFLPVLSPTAKDLDTTATIMNLSIAFYCLAVAITPLWWTSLAEKYGKRRVYIQTFFLFIIFNIIAAESVSAPMFIVIRMLAGASSAPVQALGAATVADLWPLEERGRAMGVFLLGAISGNAVGPILGGALGSRWGWRSTQWFMAIYGAIIWLLVLVFFPESPMPQQPTPQNDNERQTKGIQEVFRWALKLWRVFAKPFSLLPLLRFPPILITVCYTSINFAAYYYVMIAIQATFSKEPRNLSVLIVGLTYLPNALGNVLAATVGGRWTDRVMRDNAIKAGRLDMQNRPKPKHQDALGINVWIAGLLYPSAMIVFGWTAVDQFLAVPLVATFCFALGNMMVQNITTVILTEFLPGRAAAGVALANLVRNTLGAIVCVAAEPLLEAIGVDWTSTMVAIICMASAVCIWFLQRNADRWSKAMAEALQNSP